MFQDDDSCRMTTSLMGCRIDVAIDSKRQVDGVKSVARSAVG